MEKVLVRKIKMDMEWNDQVGVFLGVSHPTEELKFFFCSRWSWSDEC